MPNAAAKMVIATGVKTSINARCWQTCELPSRSDRLAMCVLAMNHPINKVFSCRARLVLLLVVAPRYTNRLDLTWSVLALHRVLCYSVRVRVSLSLPLLSRVPRSGRSGDASNGLYNLASWPNSHLRCRPHMCNNPHRYWELC